MLSVHRPRPSMLILMPLDFKTLVNASLVNWLPWSVLNIPGRPKHEIASSRSDTQNSVSSVFDMRQESTFRLYQSMTATRYIKPRLTGIYVMSEHQTISGRLMLSPFSK